MKRIGLMLGLVALFILGLWLHIYQLTPLALPERTLQVHLQGEVVYPGLYKVKESDRLADLLEKAGGLTQEAEEVNLARKLMDGEKIIISKAKIQDEQEEEIGEENTKPSSKLHGLTKEEWLAIPGIGPVTADAIMDFLKKHPDAVLEDLLQVKGIGEKKLEQLRSVLGKE